LRHSLKQSIFLNFTIFWILLTGVSLVISYINFYSFISEFELLAKDVIFVNPVTKNFVSSAAPNFNETFIIVKSNEYLPALFWQYYGKSSAVMILVGIILLIICYFRLNTLITKTFKQVSEYLFSLTLIDNEIPTNIKTDFQEVIQFTKIYQQDIDKLYEKNQQFQAFASHELRNELATTRSLYQYYDITVPKLWQHQDKLENIIADLLLISTDIANLCLEPVDILLLIANIIDQFNDEQINFVFADNLEWTEIMANSTWLYRGIYNLIDNALRYRIKNSPITVTVQNYYNTIIVTVKNKANNVYDFESDIKGHGIGRKVIEQVAQSFNGVFYYEIAEHDVNAILSFYL